MEVILKDIIKMVKKMDLVNFYGLMEVLKFKLIL